LPGISRYNARLMTTIHRHTLSNGLELIAEPMPGTRSVAMSLMVRAGVTAEPDDRLGLSTMLSEMICRGAGGRSAREHSDALDRLGVQRGTSAETHHLRVSATMIGQKLDEALPLLLDMVVAPNLADDALGPTRDLSLQSLDALEDEPQQRVLLELRSRHDPEPLGRWPLGKREHIETITLDDVRRFHARAFVPAGSILSFAGCLDWPHLRDRVERRLGSWTGTGHNSTVVGQARRGYHHMEADTSQVHIALAYDAVPEPDDQSVLQRAASAVLSGGMSGRLFTEVREKRGLCYAVYAMYRGQRDRGAMLGYAGTTTPRAQETLDVMVGELKRLAQGVDRDEFHRAIVGMKSRLVMQGESTGARASAIGADQYLIGRPRSLDELAAQVDAITLDDLNGFLAAHPPGPMTIVSIGSRPLSVV
jgi:predicted Zn-dependent peptidase